MMDHWEIMDLYKALLALAAGIILGSEREFKDKAAGLKTITVICLGSTLFSIISYKVGVADHDTTRIASYIVAGVGFIGAGVIRTGHWDCSQFPSRRNSVSASRQVGESTCRAT